MNEWHDLKRSPTIVGKQVLVVLGSVYISMRRSLHKWKYNREDPKPVVLNQRWEATFLPPPRDI